MIRRRDRAGQTRRRRARRRFAAALTIAGAGLLGISTAVADVTRTEGDGVEAGDHSAFTRNDLARFWKDSAQFPLYLPTTMPAGAEEYDGVGFTLDNIITDSRHPSRRVWVSYFTSDVLADGPAAFRVYQRRRDDVRAARPCGPMPITTPRVERIIKDALVTVCSTELSAGSAARRYWEEVPLSADLTAIPWLGPPEG